MGRMAIPTHPHQPRLLEPQLQEPQDSVLLLQFLYKLLFMLCPGKHLGIYFSRLERCLQALTLSSRPRKIPSETISMRTILAL